MRESKLTDTKLVCVVKTGTDFEEFQKDFMNLRDWRIEWNTKFRANKLQSNLQIERQSSFHI